MIFFPPRVLNISRVYFKVGVFNLTDVQLMFEQS